MVGYSWAGYKSDSRLQLFFLIYTLDCSLVKHFFLGTVLFMCSHTGFIGYFQVWIPYA